MTNPNTARAEAGFPAIQFQNIQETAIQLIYDYAKARLEKTDDHVVFTHNDVYVVWFCKTLLNWKALLSTTLPDQMYYEVTFDGNRNVAYIDAYKKWNNISVSLGEDSTI